MVKSQMGLLQEGVIFHRVAPKVRATVTPGQSGYSRDVADAQLLLHELMAERKGLGLPLWSIFGDLEKAFPRTWRQGMLKQLREKALLTDGMFALLGSILEADHVHVYISGVSVVLVKQGVSEGGLIGPLCFPSFMDSLTQALQEADCGVGFGISMPGAWVNHTWKGAGTPEATCTRQLIDSINCGGLLPDSAALSMSPSLEASALLALDRTAKLRLAAILHADDPVLLSSSFGGAEKLLAVQTDWAYRWKVTPHCGGDKSVVMACGPVGINDVIAGLPPLSMQLSGRLSTPLIYKISHKWLGLLWHHLLDLSVAMQGVIRSASAKFAILSGLVNARLLPLCVVVKLFEALIEGSMRFGRWLYATSPGAGEILDELYVKWARALIGAPPWRNAGVASSEVGWQISGQGRAVIDVAAKRAYFYNLEPDVYQHTFLLGHSMQGASWARRGAELLRDWGILDWPAWSTPGSSPDQYKAYVRQSVARVCHESWLGVASAHTQPVEYLALRPSMSTFSAIQQHYL